MIRKILAATDFSRNAQRAEMRAAMLGIALKCEVSGRPVTEILTDELSADLTVVGADDGNFFTRLFSGYDVDRLARMSRRPLLIVRSYPRRTYERILVAVDFSDESKEAARMALKIAPAARVAFVHAFHVPFEGQMREVEISEDVIRKYRVNAAEKVQCHLDRLIAELASDREILSRTVCHGLSVPVACNHALEIRPDLIAMGRQGRSRFGELMHGGATRRMLDQTSCDLLIAGAPETLPGGTLDQ